VLIARAITGLAVRRTAPPGADPSHVGFSKAAATQRLR
jgi:hypothetical protein